MSLCSTHQKELDADVDKAHFLVGRAPPDSVIQSQRQWYITNCADCMVLTKIVEGARP